MLPSLCHVAPAWPQAVETRIGLVIGNSAYSAGSRLPNAQRDADLIARTLRGLGFNKVTVVSDAESSGMRRALRDFSIEAAKADWAVVYYGGHGVELGGTNYLIPVDARLANERDAVFEAVPLDQVLTSIEGARKLRLVILDACRDNPFLRTMTRTMASRSLARGLGRVEPEGGILVAYAAKAGQLALDGEGENSPFVTSLTKRMSEPGLEINMVFRAVRDDVLAMTNKRQEPFVYGSLPNEAFYFTPRTEASASPAAIPAAVPVEKPPAPTIAPPLPTPAPAKLRANRAQVKPTPKPTAPRASRTGGPKCFSFGGSTHCE